MAVARRVVIMVMMMVVIVSVGVRELAMKTLSDYFVSSGIFDIFLVLEREREAA